jgi:hypothetical protein
MPSVTSRDCPHAKERAHDNSTGPPEIFL